MCGGVEMHKNDKRALTMFGFGALLGAFMGLFFALTLGDFLLSMLGWSLFAVVGDGFCGPGG